MHTTGLILLLATGVIMFFGGGLNGVQTAPYSIAPGHADALIR